MKKNMRINGWVTILPGAGHAYTRYELAGCVADICSEWGIYWNDCLNYIDFFDTTSDDLMSEMIFDEE